MEKSQTPAEGDGELREQTEKRQALAWDAEHRDGPSYGDLRDMLTSAVGKKYGNDDDWTYVCDFGDDWLVYEAGDGEKFRCSYETSGDEVTLGDPESVRATTTYAPLQSNAADTGAEERETEGAEDRPPRRRKKDRHRAVPLLPEVRHFVATGLEVRSESNTDKIVITGQPIVYNTPYVVRDVFGEFEERMLPGCASDLLDRGVDCRLLLNHEGLPMARTTAGTLRLWDTADALNFEATLDARQQLANDFAIAIERGDVSQMSVGMLVGRDKWGEDDGMETRDIYGLDDLLDVSGVTYPCSPSTNIEIARRMAMEIPVESRARARRIYAELRSGKVLSQSIQDKVVAAATALHSVLDAAGFDPESLNDPEDLNADGTAVGAVDGQQTGAQDGTTRSDTVVDPGEAIRATKTARVLAMELEARRHRRRAA